MKADMALKKARAGKPLDEFDVEEEIESTQNGGLVEMSQSQTEEQPEEDQDAA